MHIKAEVCLNIYIFLFYSFVYLFIALPLGSVCRFIFFYEFNCTDSGLQLGDPAPLIGLLLWTCWHFTQVYRLATRLHAVRSLLSRAVARYRTGHDNVQALFQFLLARSLSTKLHSVRYTVNKKLSRPSLPKIKSPFFSAINWDFRGGASADCSSTW